VHRVVERALRHARCGLATLALWALLPSSPASAQADNPTVATSAIYVRTDSDETTVIAPRLHVAAPLEESTRLDLVYTVDVWSSASIDIRTSASRRLGADNRPLEQEPVTEQRDEIDADIEHAFSDLTLSGGYRYSTEPDYESHGGSLGGGYDFADNNAKIALGVGAFFDTVGRAGDAQFEEAATTTSARVSFSQLLGTHGLMQLVYELGVQRGFLSSPYRYVRFAPDSGSVPSTCAYPVMACQLEQNPGDRMRHALAVHARHAFGNHLSLGGNYRFYLDDWEMTSHTVGIDGAWLPSDDWLLSLGYRFYHQSSAYFFEPFYSPMPRPRYYTSDKELSALSSHRFELELSHGWTLDEPGTKLQLILLLAPAFFLYDEFLPLDQVTALETTLAIEVTL
jgi:hypothetical protein